MFSGCRLAVQFICCLHTLQSFASPHINDYDIYQDSSKPALPFSDHRKASSHRFESDDDIYLPSREFGSHYGPSKLAKKKGKEHVDKKFSKTIVYQADGGLVENMTKYDDLELCNYLQCRRREVCLVSSETGQAECMHRRTLRKKLKQLGRKALIDSDIVKNLLSDHDREFSRKTQQLQNKAKLYESKHHFDTKQNSVNDKALNEASPFKVKSKKLDLMEIEESTLPTKQIQGCSKRDLDEMGYRLLDWFKQLHDEGIKERHMQKRNSKKKELRLSSECVCQSPVIWEFNHLDADSDGQLFDSELGELENNGYEHCVTPFIEACDHNKDRKLTQNEWCCCFSAFLPPCELARRNVVVDVSGTGDLRMVVGSFVPQCDEDGFYQSVQCHSSIGQCWCVDRSGTELIGSRTRGVPVCNG